MRDVVAGIVAILLVIVALRLATSLHSYRRRRQRTHDTELALGRTIAAQIPTAGDLVFVTEDDARFYYRDRSIDKDSIVAVRVLIDGSPIAAYVSRRHASATPLPPASLDERPEGIPRDRWDVAIETTSGTTLIECGAIRERVSQELARAVFDAVKKDLEKRDLDAGTTNTRRHDT